jgi:hypothetical protein
MRTRLKANGTTTIKSALLSYAYRCRGARGSGRPASGSRTCRIGWAACRQMHRRAPAQQNTMHGWLSEYRKRRRPRLSNLSNPLLLG